MARPLVAVVDPVDIVGPRERIPTSVAQPKQIEKFACEEINPGVDSGIVQRFSARPQAIEIRLVELAEIELFKPPSVAFSGRSGPHPWFEEIR